MDKNKTRFIPNNVMNRRMELGLSQAMFSELVGVSTTTISMIENGHKKPSVSTLCKMADGLQCSVSLFFYEPRRK